MRRDIFCALTALVLGAGVAVATYTAPAWVAALATIATYTAVWLLLRWMTVRPRPSLLDDRWMRELIPLIPFGGPDDDDPAGAWPPAGGGVPPAGGRRPRPVSGRAVPGTELGS